MFSPITLSPVGDSSLVGPPSFEKDSAPGGSRERERERERERDMIRLFQGEKKSDLKSDIYEYQSNNANYNIIK